MSTNMKRAMMITCAAVVLCGVGTVAYFGLKREGAPPSGIDAEQRTDSRVNGAKKPLAQKPGHAVERPGTGRVVRARSRLKLTNQVVRAAQKVNLTEDERKATEMRELLDSGNEKEALSMARALMNSPEPGVRSSVMTVLGWIGVRALPEITQMLGDADESVAQDALTQWKMAFDEVDGDGARADLLVAAMGTMTKVEDMESLALSFSQIPDGLAVASLVTIIQGQNTAAGEVARQQYEFITQSAYTTPEAADLWIREQVAQENPVAP